MNILVLLGLPGAGKTFVGKILEKEFGFYAYEADNAMPQLLQEAIRKQDVISDSLRDSFFDQMRKETKKLQEEYDKIVVTQVFIKEKYREQFLETFPQAKFILVEASDEIREDRLMKQKKWQLDLAYWRKMTEIFETPHIEHVTITNNNEGEEDVKKQLTVILASEARPESL